MNPELQDFSGRKTLKKGLVGPDLGCVRTIAVTGEKTQEKPRLGFIPSALGQELFLRLS